MAAAPPRLFLRRPPAGDNGRPTDERTGRVSQGGHVDSFAPTGGFPMPYRPNYRIERAERDRAKRAKKEEKIKQQQERAALRKTGNAENPDDPQNPDEPQNPDGPEHLGGPENS
jgi:hypothetical protein